MGRDGDALRLPVVIRDREPERCREERCGAKLAAAQALSFSLLPVLAEAWGPCSGGHRGRGGVRKCREACVSAKGLV